MHINPQLIEYLQLFDANDYNNDLFCCYLRDTIGYRDVGYVYLMANDHMPGVYKIGKSANPKRRCKELSKETGVPGEYMVVTSIEVPSHSWVEHKMHKHLERKRVKGSEHFKINPSEFNEAFEFVVNDGLKKHGLSLSSNGFQASCDTAGDYFCSIHTIQEYCKENKL